MAGYATTFNTTFTSGRRDSLTNNFPTYREDVAPEPAYMQGIETPISETVTSKPAGSKDFECLMDDIPDQKTTVLTGEVQFADWTTGHAVTAGRVRCRSSTQIRSRKFAVADSEMTQDEYGIGNEYDQANWKQLQALGLDMEMIALWNELEFNNAGVSTTHGLIPWALDTSAAGTINLGTIGGAPTSNNQIPDPFKATVYAGSAPLTKITLRDNIMQPAWSKGFKWAQALTFVGPRVRNAWSGFSHVFNGSGATLSASPLNSREIPASLMKIIDNVDIYHGPWGIVYVTNHRKLDSDTAIANVGAANVSITPSKALLAYDPDYVSFRFKRKPRTYHLPRLGDGAAGVTLVEFGVEVRNPRALVFAYDIG